MKKFLWLAVLALAMPMATWANSTTLVFQNTGGKMTTNGTTLTLTGSTLTSLTDLGGTTYTGSLGTVSFTTGALTSGSLGNSALFGTGGSFTIVGNGSNGIPAGTLFTGSFVNANWVGTFNPKGDKGLGNWTYVLTANVQGTLSNGSPASGVSLQFTFDVPNSKPFGSGQTVRLKNGVTTVTVPEPGTLTLFGTGLVGLAGLIRRRLSR
jgi:hypothetical protein